MSAKPSTKARRKRRAEAELARTEAALARECPTCKQKPGVWCGPRLTHAVFHPITPWIHERRYAA